MKLTQREKVLRHLEEFGHITPMEAIQDYGILRLGARIWDLRAQGYSIRTKYVSGKNRFGEPTCYARYEMERVS